MSIADVKNSLMLWAIDGGIFEILPDTSLDSDTNNVELPLTFEHLEFFKFRKIFKIEDTGRTITIATRMAIKKQKTDELKNILESAFSNLKLAVNFTVERPFKIDQKVQPTITPISWNNKRIACGSSIGVGNQRNTGTLTALAENAEGRLFGISCNHVTGGCNTTQKGTPIVSPGIQDVSPNSPTIYGLGLHFLSGRMTQGLPTDNKIHLENTDVSIFEISDSSIVTTMQGAGEKSYDTPTSFIQPTQRMMVQKWGRTTKHTIGRVSKILEKPEPMPYDVKSFYGPNTSQVFKGVVYYSNVIEVENYGGKNFSKGGDSGALVVSVPNNPEEREHIIGILIGGNSGNNAKSYVLPIEDVLTNLQIQIISGR